MRHLAQICPFHKQTLYVSSTIFTSYISKSNDTNTNLFPLVAYINRNKCRIIEGQLRCKELLDYLRRMKVELRVWLCEDATGINAKIEYHPSTNQLVGIVLPLDPSSGMPVQFSFLAKSAEDIEKYSKERLSTLVYVVLAQPMKPNVPPFIIHIFGTDNKFTSMNVMKRLEYTSQELRK